MNDRAIDEVIEVMKYGFVNVIRSIPTLWKGCYLLLARALPPVVFMA